MLSARDCRFVEEAREILTREFASPPQLRVLARRVGTNGSRLCAGFVRQFGETISEYVRRQRMQYAHELLATSDMQVHRIALQVGYQHHSTFTAAFVKHFGEPPKRIRQSRPDGAPHN